MYPKIEEINGITYYLNSFRMIKIHMPLSYKVIGHQFQFLSLSIIFTILRHFRAANATQAKSARLKGNHVTPQIQVLKP